MIFSLFLKALPNVKRKKTWKTFRANGISSSSWEEKGVLRSQVRQLIAVTRQLLKEHLVMIEKGASDLKQKQIGA